MTEESSELKDLRPNRWARLRVLYRRWDRKFFISEALFSFLLVFVSLLLLRSEWSPQAIRNQSALNSLYWGFCLAFLSLWSFAIFLRKEWPQVLENYKDVLVGLGLIPLSVAVFKLALILQIDILAKYFVGIPALFFVFCIPVVAPAMIFRLLVNGPLTLFFSLIYSACMGLFMHDVLFGLHVFVSSILGSLFISQARTRSSLHLAGLRTAMVSGLSAFVAAMIWGKDFSFGGDFLLRVNLGPWALAAWSFGAGALGGWLSSAFAMTITPLLESLFDYTTDLKLLELSRMDHPLLRDLVMKAPGTYHHSIVVGSLCEAGAEAIGANALLCRVAAYYHDVGKIGRSEYFVENQNLGTNPHEGMKPHLSAKIIISHVKEGRNLAREYKLGEAITDFIMQHHGKSMVSFFYNKALQEAAQPGSGMDPAEVSEEDFRYPGPNPQTKETAIMALADSCEAATRSLVDPTPARIEAMVDKIFQKAISEGLLDEAEINLKELHAVNKAFVRILLALHHGRIQYPDQEKGLPQRPNVTPLKGSGGRGST